MPLYSRASLEGRTEPGRDTPCAPTYLSGSCGQEISALSEAPDSASQVSDLLRPSGAPVPIRCVSMRPAAVLELAFLQYKPVPRPGRGDRRASGF